MRPGGVKTISATSPVSFAQLGNQQSVAWVGVINDSPFTVLADFGNGASDYIPAYQTKYYATADLGFQWFGALNVSVVSVPSNVSNAPTSDIAVALYSPGEQVSTAAVPISRSLVSVADITAQFLEGDGQSLALTELDTVSGNPMLLPANGAGIATAIGARDAGNVAREVVDVAAEVENEFQVFAGNGSGGYGAIKGNNFYIIGVVKNLSGLFTVGNTGVSGIVAKQKTTGITSTALQTVLTFSVVTEGMYRINANYWLNNGTSPQNITFQVAITSGIGAGARTLSGLSVSQGNGPNRADGTVAHNNSMYYAGAIPVYCAAGSTITVTYRDPANTPNDAVAVYVEYLG